MRIAIVDDHPLVREGLAARIFAQPDLDVCWQAADPDEAMALLRNEQPHLLILDLAFKGSSGLDLIKKLNPGGGGPRVLVISAYEEELFAERVLRAGAQGYLNKQELQGSAIDAIRAVLRGEFYMSAGMAQRLAGQAASRGGASRGLEALSDREMQIFDLIGRGIGTRAIAEQLHLSVHTVESHRENIRTKLNLRNGTELLRQAMLWTLENRS
jgi:DNA-binding NarL/FixJ family response regulator